MNGPGPTSTTSPPALEMFDVTVTMLHDPSVVVLEGVNWRVEGGDFWAIGGLLRSGKSDLMAVAAGLMPPRSGVIRFLGRDETGFEGGRLDLRRRIGMVFDGGHLIHHLTLAENIALPLRYHEDGNEEALERRVERLMAFTDLEPWGGRRPSQVNRNWQQRIGLARALALGPDVLLLDSPLTGLDPRDTAWWLEKLDGLHRGDPVLENEPLTVVVTTDDLRPWQSRASQFAVLKDGHFIALGDRAGLSSHPEPLLRELLPTPAVGT